MKIWHIPPRYLDDATLIAEWTCLRRLNEQFKTPFSSIDSFYQKYKNHIKYVAQRYILVSRELVVRGLSEYEVDEPELLENTSNIKSYQFSLSDVNRDIEILTMIWSEFEQFDNRIFDCLEKLGLTDSEQLHQELLWINQQLIEEYY